jgi:hypothetical protein
MRLAITVTSRAGGRLGGGGGGSAGRPRYPLKFYKDRHSALIEAIIRQFHSERNFNLQMYRRTKGVIDIGRGAAQGWRDKGAVASGRVEVLAKALNCSPFALNYDLMRKKTGEQPSWESVVRSVKFLPRSSVKYLLTFEKKKRKEYGKFFVCFYGHNRNDVCYYPGYRFYSF